MKPIGFANFILPMLGMLIGLSIYNSCTNSEIDSKLKEIERWQIKAEQTTFLQIRNIQDVVTGNALWKQPAPVLEQQDRGFVRAGYNCDSMPGLILKMVDDYDLKSLLDCPYSKSLKRIAAHKRVVNEYERRMKNGVYDE